MFGVPGGCEQLQFYLQSVSINGWIGAFISEPRATVISQQRVFCWSEGDFTIGIRHPPLTAAQASNASATPGVRRRRQHRLTKADLSFLIRSGLGGALRGGQAPYR